jgi:putative transposase
VVLRTDSTFLRNHAQNIVACDFFVLVTSRFCILYVFVALQIGSRQIVHGNVTEHPTAQWTLQQLHEAIPAESDFQFLLHDRDNIFSAHLVEEVENWGTRVLKSPVRMPTAIRKSNRNRALGFCSSEIEFLDHTGAQEKLKA